MIITTSHLQFEITEEEALCLSNIFHRFLDQHKDEPYSDGLWEDFVESVLTLTARTDFKYQNERSNRTSNRL